ncbi:hypothetical protein QR680_018042 [Steinernema hermaphroditum]|uniref:SAM-dependent MTase TRM10-type domain-containing protein n=1 Tax=Steinernema hermaphroditum TaxID=289476 RepID=A0AA39HGQ1_9BILA|nr:hypothetical protein QR680_018042 [Steinernema hermaphroditum]
MTSKLMPSAALLAKIVRPEQKKIINRVMKEVEIYEYMATKVPQQMTDECWVELLERKTLSARVQYLEFLAVRERRQARDKSTRRGTKEEVIAASEEQRQRYDDGGMGYGPELYQLLNNPLRNKKRVRHSEGMRVWESMRTDVPEVAIDLQHFSSMDSVSRSKVGKQIQYAISENFASRRPMPLSFYGYNMSNPAAAKLFERCVGYYNMEYTDQVVLPSFYNGTVADIKKSGKRVVYISNAARRMLDGPLKNDVYILCASKDTGRSALSSSRANNIPVYNLPIKKYVKWESGPQFLPLNNVVRILREVYLNYGDWETALRNNISNRHLMSYEARLEKNEMFIKKQGEKQRYREELLQLIQDGTRGL